MGCILCVLNLVHGYRTKSNLPERKPITVCVENLNDQKRKEIGLAMMNKLEHEINPVL